MVRRSLVGFTMGLIAIAVVTAGTASAQGQLNQKVSQTLTTPGVAATELLTVCLGTGADPCDTVTTPAVPAQTVGADLQYSLIHASDVPTISNQAGKLNDLPEFDQNGDGFADPHPCEDKTGVALVLSEANLGGANVSLRATHNGAVVGQEVSHEVPVQHTGPVPATVCVPVL